MARWSRLETRFTHFYYFSFKNLPGVIDSYGYVLFELLSMCYQGRSQYMPRGSRSPGILSTASLFFFFLKHAYMLELNFFRYWAYCSLYCHGFPTKLMGSYKNKMLI